MCIVLLILVNDGVQQTIAIPDGVVNLELEPAPFESPIEDGSLLLWA